MVKWRNKEKINSGILWSDLSDHLPKPKPEPSVHHKHLLTDDNGGLRVANVGRVEVIFQQH